METAVSNLKISKYSDNIAGLNYGYPPSDLVVRHYEYKLVSALILA
jgi:hypothetical protein